MLCIGSYFRPSEDRVSKAEGLSRHEFSELQSPGGAKIAANEHTNKFFTAHAIDPPTTHLEWILNGCLEKDVRGSAERRKLTKDDVLEKSSQSNTSVNIEPRRHFASP